MQYDIESVLNFITSRQNLNGSFSTWESYPVVRPGEGWLVLPDSSPFITANILCSLLTLNRPELKPVIEKGCSFLQSCMEYGGYWRFWPKMAKQHPIPLDMDDTSVASYVLEQAGWPVNNKAAMARNCNSKGYYYTWFIPTFSNLVARPGTAFNFLLGCIHGLPTRLINFYTYTDKEPAVAANVLLYLGGNEQTKKAVDCIIDEIKGGKLRLQFYHDEIMVYYHVSRAYKAGVESFGLLKNCILERLVKRLKEPEKMDELLRLMSAIILLDFAVENNLAASVIEGIGKGEMYPANWQVLPYFSSENRNFLAGSPEFTAVIFAEAAHKLNMANIAV